MLFFLSNFGNIPRPGIPRGSREAENLGQPGDISSLGGNMNLCKTCKWWFQKRDWKWGTCKRYPPMTEDCSQPISTEEDWCGEFKKTNLKRKKNGRTSN